MAIDARRAIPAMPTRIGTLQERRDWLMKRVATCITVLTAAIAVLVVAAAAVASAII